MTVDCCQELIFGASQNSVHFNQMITCRVRIDGNTIRTSGIPGMGQGLYKFTSLQRCLHYLLGLIRGHRWQQYFNVPTKQTRANGTKGSPYLPSTSSSSLVVCFSCSSKSHFDVVIAGSRRHDHTVLTTAICEVKWRVDQQCGRIR